MTDLSTYRPGTFLRFKKGFKSLLVEIPAGTRVKFSRCPQPVSAEIRLMAADDRTTLLILNLPRSLIEHLVVPA